MTNLMKRLRNKHLIVLGQTGSGKTTFFQTAFLEDVLDNNGQPIFRCHVFPDYESVKLYKALDIPIYETVEEVFQAYIEMKTTHCAFAPPPLLVSGVDPSEEVLLLLEVIFQEKFFWMKDGEFSTHEFYFFIDEIQNIMTKHSIDKALQTVFSEGRKYRMFIIGGTQSALLINNFSMSQANKGFGYIDNFERKYMNDRNLFFPDEFFTIWVEIMDENNKNSIFEYKSKSKPIRKVKREFKNRGIQD